MRTVSVLFNESKLLKWNDGAIVVSLNMRFSTLQRVEIAEMYENSRDGPGSGPFQYSSTSRNC